jgi:DNA polymerase III epsilon subunit-like protein
VDTSRSLKGFPLAVLDTETTGLDPATAHVVDVAVVHTEIGAGGARVAFSSLVKPPIAIPADSTRITGIDDAMVAAAPAWADVAARVAEACEGRLVVAYNAPYDYRIVRAENERAGAAAPAWPWLDLLVVRKATKRRGRPGRLHELALEYGIKLDAHGATGDALTTAYLATPMLRAAWSSGMFRGATVAELLLWQRMNAIAQERDYADYCRKRGDATPPRCDWHAIEGVTAPTWEPAARPVPCACGARVIWKIGKAGSRVAHDVDGGEAHVCAAGVAS